MQTPRIVFMLKPGVLRTRITFNDRRSNMAACDASASSDSDANPSAHLPDASLQIENQHKGKLLLSFTFFEVFVHDHP